MDPRQQYLYPSSPIINRLAVKQTMKQMSAKYTESIDLNIYFKILVPRLTHKTAPTTHL